MQLSIIVITKNHSERLEATIASAAGAAPWAELVLVCDGGQIFECVTTWAKQSFDNYAAVTLTGQGRAAARNAGANAASGDQFVFLDGDMVFSPTSLAELAAQGTRGPTLRRGAVLELLGAALAQDLSVGGSGFPPMHIPDLQANGFFPGGYRCAQSVLEQAVTRRFVDGERHIPDWIAASGAFFAIDANLWRDLGGQNEGFGTTWGCEDLEFSYRAIASGALIDYRPAAIGYHLSHLQPDRWISHAGALTHFEEATGDASVRTLQDLLAVDGSVARYVAALERR